MVLKLLIADDEELELRALRQFVQDVEDVTVVAEARNGPEAVRLAEATRPDLSLVDIKMPGMSGLDAIRGIRRFHPDMKSIIITAYEDFGFVHEAMSLGAVDYLLKPVPQEQVLTAVRRVARAAREECERREAEMRAQERLNAAAPFIQTGLVLDMIAGPPREQKELLQRAALAGLTSLPSVALAVSVDHSAVPSDSQDELARQVTKKQVHEIVSGLIGGNSNCLSVVIGGDDLIVLAGPPDDDSAQVLRLAEQIRSRVAASMNVTVTVGVGLRSPVAGQLGESYKTALTALRLGRFVLGHDRVVHINEVDGFASPLIPGQLEMEKELADRVRWGDHREATAACDRLLNAYLGHERAAGGILRTRLLELIVILSRAAAEGGSAPDQAMEMTGPLIRSLQECRTEGEFRSWAAGAVTQFTALVAGTFKSTTARAMARVTDYIDTHYAEEISVAEVAHMVFLNASYFCRAFKQQTGRTFVDYLTHRRIERAQGLLASTDLPVSTVARQVGYRDPNYFSRVFAQVTGLSPSEFRHRLLRQMPS